MDSTNSHPAIRSTTEHVARRAGLSVDAVDRIFDAILEELALDRIVVIPGFGKFKPGSTGERRFTTPVIEGEVRARARRCVRFNQAKRASRKLNEEV